MHFAISSMMRILLFETVPLNDKENAKEAGIKSGTGRPSKMVRISCLFTEG